MSRETIYQALFDLGSTVTWGNGKVFISPSRRVRAFSEIQEWPTFSQAEHSETVTNRTNMPNLQTLSAVWLIYHNAGKDKSAIPAIESNTILDALDALFPSDDSSGGLQTLGGLVHRVAISGRILKENGDLDGQALLIVPLQIIVP